MDGLDMEPHSLANRYLQRTRMLYYHRIFRVNDTVPLDSDGIESVLNPTVVQSFITMLASFFDFSIFQFFYFLIFFYFWIFRFFDFSLYTGINMVLLILKIISSTSKYNIPNQAIVTSHTRHICCPHAA